MKKTTTLLSAVLLMISVFVSNQSRAQMSEDGHMDTSSVFAESRSCMLKTNMRKLWEDHVLWTRNVIICLVDNTPGTDEAVKRLLENQVDIGNAIKPYYGEAAGSELTKLLKTHIVLAAEVVKAAKAGDNAKLGEENRKWYANAEDISKFLSKANPHWPLADMKKMMSEHLKLTTEEALNRIKINYAADVVTYDKVHDEILQMSDMLAAGIVKQFPDKFK